MFTWFVVECSLSVFTNIVACIAGILYTVVHTVEPLTWLEYYLVAKFPSVAYVLPYRLTDVVVTGIHH